MKLFIASDIHGSAYYANLMVDRFHAENADRMILLGDVLYHGPRNDLPREYDPKAVISLLNPLKDKILCVKGNCESEVDSMVLDFNVESNFMTILADDVAILATHGHRTNPPMCGCDILLCGHTHVPALEERDGYYYVNPGSTSIPKEASPHSYMTVDGKTLRWFDINTAECYKEFSLK